MAPKTLHRDLLKELSTSLNESTYDVDSPYKARQRASILKSTAPFTGKTYFDTMPDTSTPTVHPKATYVYSTLLDTALTLEMIQSAKKIRPYRLEIPVNGDKNRLRVELKDGTNWIVKIPDPDSDASKELNRTSNWITEIHEGWAKEEWMRELEELKWEVFSKDQMKLADTATVRIWERDFFTRQTKKDIREKLMNGYVFIVQKQQTFGTASFCSYVFCLSPEGRTPLASYRLSLEPRENLNLLKVPEDAIDSEGKRGFGAEGAQWFCLTCIEAMWNGVNLITTTKLAEIAANVGHVLAPEEAVDITMVNSDSDGDSGSQPLSGSSKRQRRVTPAVKVGGRRLASKATKTKSGNTSIRKGNQAATTSKEGRNSPGIEKEHPRLPALPDSLAPFMSLSQSLYSFMHAETRDHEQEYFTLPLPQHAALLKWKTTIVRRTENEVKCNTEYTEQTGIPVECNDADDNLSHDEEYWIKIQGSNIYAQIRGLVDPFGEAVELCTAECRDKELSEIFGIVDAKVQAAWDRVGYVPQPPRSKLIVKLKFNYLKYFPHLRERVAGFRAQYPQSDDVEWDTSGDISSSSSSSEEF